MAKYLITGIQGSGKSAIAAQLGSLGSVIDSDTISEWVDSHDNPLTQSRPKDPTLSWLNSHYWVWNPLKLEELFGDAAYTDLLLCGLSWNQEKYYHLFDKIVALKLDEETLKYRLAHRLSGNFGKNPKELEYILKNADNFYTKALSAGAVLVDATQPVEIVATDVSMYLSS